MSELISSTANPQRRAILQFVYYFIKVSITCPTGYLTVVAEGSDEVKSLMLAHL